MCVLAILELFGIAFENKAFKLKKKKKKKKRFLAEASFLSFCQKYVLVIFRLFGPLKALSIFFYQTSTFFFKQIF
jgi:hypothetical protein